MLICKGGKSYKCSKIKANTVGDVRCLRFTILEHIPITDIINLFEDSTFYFYDDVLNGRMIDTNNTKLVGLSITHNADFTHTIKIKLKKELFLK